MQNIRSGRNATLGAEIARVTRTRDYRRLLRFTRDKRERETLERAAGSLARGRCYARRTETERHDSARRRSCLRLRSPRSSPVQREERNRSVPLLSLRTHVQLDSRGRPGRRGRNEIIRRPFSRRITSARLRSRLFLYAGFSYDFFRSSRMRLEGRRDVSRDLFILYVP